MKTISLQLILFLLLSSLVYAQKNAGLVNQSLRRELSRMLKDDQKYRGAITEVDRSNLAPDVKEKRLSDLAEKQDRLDKRNIKKLAKIIEKYGWPARSSVGKEGSLAAFLVVQHGDLGYQKKYFPLLKEAVNKGEADRDDAALLEDRILMREGKKQIYGTQLQFNEGTKKLELWPIEDEEGVDTRRASVGLEPLAEYMKRFGLEYKASKKK
ncbi:MAG TPA: DUF6624 domain-containing protein [Blastocatellia bacterium]|nr:DUF6624 domain-containing protein [Blastocatellia bacterium]